MADFTVTGRAGRAVLAFTDACAKADAKAAGRPYRAVIANLPARGIGPYGDTEFPVIDGQDTCVLACTYTEGGR